ncbi:MAG: amidohydrolase family protein [Gammaproteobacteria bacterium]|nr:amidohydrolase family protein [Gammaproteobacteria bacterium]
MLNKCVKNLFVFSVLFSNFSCLAAQGNLIIKDITLIDGTGRAAMSNMNILIEGEMIKKVQGSDFSKSERRGARIIKGKGKYLIPGLMDIHIHLVGSTKVSKEGIRKVALDRAKGIRALQGYLYSGVTSVYDSGNVPEYIFELREQERAGEISSPRIFAAGGIVTYPGSHGSGAGATLLNEWPSAIPALDKHLSWKPDMVKLTLEERGWGARPLIPLLPLSLMEEIIRYTNYEGVRTTAHAASELRAMQAIYAGVDSLSHPVITGPISDKFAPFMAIKQTPMATTLTIGENYSRLVEHPEFLEQALYQATFTKEEISQLKTEQRDKYKDATWTWWMKLMTPIAQENIRKINEAGGILALGTDKSSGPAVHREMELLVKAGIPIADVIRIATLHGAKFLGKDRELGSISAGKLADMVILDSDPLLDINNAKHINTVIKNGQVVDRSKLRIQ